jgi:hypothetical protein
VESLLPFPVWGAGNAAILLKSFLLNKFLLNFKKKKKLFAPERGNGGTMKCYELFQKHVLLLIFQRTMCWCDADRYT